MGTENTKLQAFLLSVSGPDDGTCRRNDSSQTIGRPIAVANYLYVNLDADMPNWDLGLENYILSRLPLMLVKPCLLECLS